MMRNVCLNRRERLRVFQLTNKSLLSLALLKILQLSSAQTLGGGERHLIDLANGLVDRGHEIYAALRPRSPLIPELARLPQQNILTLPLRNALDPVSARKLARFVSRNEIEIVHAHMARDYPLAVYAARRNPAKTIVTRHVLFPLNRLHTITLSQVARVIAVSEAVARGLRAQGLLPAERISVVHNGIDIQRFANAREHFDRRRFCRAWQIPADHLLIGTVGELKPLKGHEDFLRAAAIVARHFSNAEFLIAGVDASRSGENRARLESLIAKLDLANQVRLVGWLDDLPQFYCALDVFVSASQSESFGLAIAEAMACATPVVATSTEGAKEIIENRQAGYLVPVGDIESLVAAIVDLLQDQDQAHRTATLAHERMQQRFSLERMVGATERIYRDVLVERSDDN
jgi:L-malate glycosyltransferase